MIHTFKFIGEGGAALELRLDDGKHDVVEESKNNTKKKAHLSLMSSVKKAIYNNGSMEQDKPPRIYSTRQMIQDIREEEGQKERDRIQKEGIGKVSIIIQKDKP